MSDYTSAVYVFDLDGVITNPADSSVNSGVVAHIYDILGHGGYAAVNTGRSYEWVGQNLLRQLQKNGTPEVFTRLYIVCEKGGESLVWQDDHFEGQPSRFALDAKAYDATKHTFLDNEDNLDTMFWDATKRTMATIEKKAASNLAEFHTQQQQLVTLLTQSTESYDVKVDATTIATDVESPHAGKHAGAELIYEWVSQHADATHDRFTCFGDSVSDYEMARYFAQQGAKTTFVFVGKPSAKINEDERVGTIRTTSQYDSGAMEYLESLLAPTEN